MAVSAKLLVVGSGSLRCRRGCGAVHGFRCACNDVIAFEDKVLCK